MPDSFKGAARPIVIGVPLALLLLIAPSILGPADLTLATTWLVLAGLVYAIDLVFGMLGYLSLVHVGFWGMAAYTVILLQERQHWGFGPASLAACGVAVGAAALVGLFAFRTEHYYFAILTFIGLSFIVLAITNLKTLTGGAEGVFYFGKSDFFGWDLVTRAARYRFTALVLIATAVYVALVRRSSFGKKCRAIGEAQALAEAVGLNPFNYKIALFAISALPLGLVGASYALTTSALEPTLFGPNIAIATVLMAILGGSGTALGPLVGAAVYVFVPAKLPFDPSVNQAVVGLIFIAVIRFRPRGLMNGVPRIAWRARRDRKDASVAGLTGE